MTVQELKEKLAELPEDALVMVKHDLVGYEHFIEDVEYKENDYHDYRKTQFGIVWLKETKG